MKLITLAIICFFLVFSCCSVNAGDEAPAVEWDRSYGAIWGYGVCSSGDGGYVFAGWKGDPTINDGEVWAAKLEFDYVYSEIDFSASFVSSDWVTGTVATVAVCGTVIAVGAVIYKRRVKTSKTQSVQLHIRRLITVDC